MAIVLDLYSLYMDGIPVPVGITYTGEKLTIGEAVPGMEIPWLVRQDSLVACNCLCIFVSWDQLNKQGLITGVPIQLPDGMYLCRCIRFSGNAANLGEWDTILEESESCQDKFVWNNAFFWGQESTYENNGRTVCGLNSPRFTTRIAADTQASIIGWRPILEPLGVRSADPNALIGRKVKVWGPSGLSVDGVLVEASDYDLVLDTPTALLNARGWSLMDGGRTILDRTRVTWLKEVEG